ncbi:hypothetical protein A2U01_0060731, partial [Trifolium medium]|nr:hypothetical protein [Trifolium medium]
ISTTAKTLLSSQRDTSSPPKSHRKRNQSLNSGARNSTGVERYASVK